MGTTVSKKVKMKSIIFFLFALVIVISTIDAKRLKGRTTTAWLKVKEKRWAKIRNTPSKCCNKKGLITAKTFYQSAAGQCDMLCPLLKTLKGCEFMCHFHLCYMAYVAVKTSVMYNVQLLQRVQILLERDQRLKAFLMLLDKP